MSKKYVKSHSNYIIRSNPTPTKGGYVYENDLPTTAKGYNTVNGNMITSSDGGFVFVVNTTPDDKKNYNNDGWGQNRYTLADLNVTKDDFQRTTDTSNNLSLKNQKYVTLNKSYDFLSDYCYFGSSNAMLKAAIDDIISNFPAGIYIKSSTTGTTIRTSNYDNKLLIDVFNYYPEDRIKLMYDLKVMATSYLDYEVVMINTSGETYIGDVIGFTGSTTEDNTLTFNISGGTNIFTDSLLIRPKISKRNDFFNNLDDFQQTILNQHSIPDKYMSTFKIPKDGLNGIEYEYKTFKWATSDGYNIDIESSNYTNFMSDLINATNMIDEIYCDNIYRMLTHDSIKNLDSTYNREIDDEALEEIIVGGTQVQKMLRLYGRSFDELKKYIEGISFVNTITYDGKNNLPIDYLSGKLDTSGWDVFSLLNEIDSSEKTIPGLYPGTTRVYDVNDVNNEILRRLIINSNHIFKSKGTVKSVRKILGLLGFENNWYETREYVQVVDNLINSTTLEKIAALNYNIYPAGYSVSDGKPEYYYSVDESLFDNTNVGIVVKCPSGSSDYIVSGDTCGEDNTGVGIEFGEVFDLTANTYGYPRPCTNSTDYYFQQKGNWYRETGGLHEDLSGNTIVTDISYGNNPHIGDGMYDNGYDYVNQFEDIFKRYVRSATNTPITGYTGIGFTMTTGKVNNNVKISYNNPNELLTLNLKNFVIGVDGNKVLQSYFYKNDSVKKLSNEVSYHLTDSDSDYVIISDTTGVTSFGNPQLSTDRVFKVHNDINGNGNDIITNSVIIKPGETIILRYNSVSGELNPEYYNCEDEFNILKSIALPYLEQLIPSTTIFDFMLIDNKTPKWLLVDEYCERGDDGLYTGYKIIAYQNVNYYDSTTTGPDYNLTGVTIPQYFGTGFIYVPEMTISKSTVMKTETYNNLTMETGIYSYNESSSGFDNIYFFKKASEDCGLNIDAVWAIDPTVII